MRKFLLYSLVAILAFHGVALFYRWYYSVWWLDIPMHIIGGAWVGLSFFYISRLHKTLPRSRALLIFQGIAAVALVGVLWEFYELAADVLVFHSYPLTHAPGYLHFDTLKDLFDDIVGGLLALGFATRDWSATSGN